VAIETAFLDMMPSSVTVFPASSTDEYGKFSFGAGVATNCRIQETGQVVKTADNRNVFEQGRIIFYGTPTISTSSKIVLPSGAIPDIISVQVHNDDTGAHHTTVSFGG